MDGINFIQDLAIVLLAAGIAGSLCKRMGLSVIVGYLLAGIAIGPHTPPVSVISDVERIETLSQLGLVFLMFAIGLHLSITKLTRMGLPILIATGLGAFFVLHLTQLLGIFTGWSSLQSLFIASILLVSSSAVTAKIVNELKLTHVGFAQRALGITIVEDVLAVIMLTVLAARAQATGGSGNDTDIGSLLTSLSAFVVLLVGAGLLFVPRLLRRLEARADPELQTIVVAGVLFLLAICAAKAGYSLALGAFLLGAIVAEMPQKAGVEKSFAGMRDLFSSVFFVAIGMMIDVSLLADVWHWIIGLFVFSMIARPLAIGTALVLTGTPSREARRAGLLLTPLGEFTFIIAQLGVSTQVLPPEYYPLAVGTSILTVLATPVLNRYAAPIMRLGDRLEPRWFTRAVDAYHGWLQQARGGRSSPVAWKLINKRLPQIVIEMMLVSGVLIFSSPVLRRLEGTLVTSWLDESMIDYAYWGVTGLIILVLLVAIWRNINAVILILAESLGLNTRLPASVIEKLLRAIALTALGYWLYALLPIASLPGWGWAVIAAAGLVIAVLFSRRLIYWHSNWHTSVQAVLEENPDGPQGVRAEARTALDQGLEDWGMHLEEYTIPDTAAYAGHDLARLAIPTRFGCSVIEVERNGHVITRTTSDLSVYPGDKLLLLGQEQGLVAARDFLNGETNPAPESDEFSGSILQTHVLPDGPLSGRTIADLRIAQQTGVRIAGIQRGNLRILNPRGHQELRASDNLLVVGTLEELNTFRRWLKNGGVIAPLFPKGASSG